MNYRTLAIASVVLAGLAAPAAATVIPGPFVVRESVSAKASINSVNDAIDLLNGQIASQSQTEARYRTINFWDPQNGAPGHFGGDVPFPSNTARDDYNFALSAVGYVSIPQPGNWTFGVTSDDGFMLKVGEFSLAHAGPQQAIDRLATFNFTKAGKYKLNLTYFEQGNAAGVELYAAKGSFSNFTAGASSFHLVGDTQSGGLSVSAPEPSGLGLLALGGLLLRRRRNVD